MCELYNLFFVSVFQNYSIFMVFLIFIKQLNLVLKYFLFQKIYLESR